MTELSKLSIFKQLLEKGPIILLFIATLNEFDFNYLGLKYFSFNFPFILIYYWSLKRPGSLGYGLIFLSGLFNDAVVGLPIGVSSLSYLFICGFSSYLRNITLRPSRMNGWLFFGFTILVVNSLMFAISNIFFNVQIVYEDILVNMLFTFLFYILFSILFELYKNFVYGASSV
jgi:rod shape-determining protein MreD